MEDGVIVIVVAMLMMNVIMRLSSIHRGWVGMYDSPHGPRDQVEDESHDTHGSHAGSVEPRRPLQCCAPARHHEPARSLGP
jgi:hypothetical protein